MPNIKPATLSDVPVIKKLAYSILPGAYKNIISEDQMKYMLNLIYSPASLKNK